MLRERDMEWREQGLCNEEELKGLLRLIKRRFGVDCAEEEPLIGGSSSLPEDPQALQRERIIECIREWIEEGRREGRREGQREGEQKLLLRQLERKFGAVDPTARRRIETAEEEQLVTWGENLLSAERLEDVFAS